MNWGLQAPPVVGRHHPPPPRLPARKSCRIFHTPPEDSALVSEARQRAPPAGPWRGSLGAGKVGVLQRESCRLHPHRGCRPGVPGARRHPLAQEESAGTGPGSGGGCGLQEGAGPDTQPSPGAPHLLCSGLLKYRGCKSLLGSALCSPLEVGHPGCAKEAGLPKRLHPHPAAAQLSAARGVAAVTVAPSQSADPKRKQAHREGATCLGPLERLESPSAPGARDERGCAACAGVPQDEPGCRRAEQGWVAVPLGAGVSWGAPGCVEVHGPGDAAAPRRRVSRRPGLLAAWTVQIPARGRPLPAVAPTSRAESRGRGVEGAAGAEGGGLSAVPTPTSALSGSSLLWLRHAQRCWRAPSHLLLRDVHLSVLTPPKRAPPYSAPRGDSVWQYFFFLRRV